MMIVLHGKHYYPADVYPILIAAGGVAVERWVRRRSALRYAVAADRRRSLVLLSPFSLPVLAEGRRWCATRRSSAQLLHIQRSTMATEHQSNPRAARRLGRHARLARTRLRPWPVSIGRCPLRDGAQAVDRRQQLRRSRRGRLLRPRYGLPPAISGHNNYWLWGTRGYNGNVIIDVNGDCGATSFPGLFRVARLAARSNPPWVISYERSIPISVCTGIRTPLSQLWPKLRDYI